MILLPLQHDCKTLTGARNAWKANFKFRGIDGKIIRPNDIPAGTTVTIQYGNRNKLIFTTLTAHSVP